MDKLGRIRRLGYGDMCFQCRHSAPFHWGVNGPCKLTGCGCDGFRDPPLRPPSRRRRPEALLSDQVAVEE